jgi:hypothetical protein
MGMKLSFKGTKFGEGSQLQGIVNMVMAYLAPSGPSAELLSFKGIRNIIRTLETFGGSISKQITVLLPKLDLLKKAMEKQVGFGVSKPYTADETKEKKFNIDIKKHVKKFIKSILLIKYDIDDPD